MTDLLPELTDDDPRIVKIGDVVVFVTYPTSGAIFTSEGAVLIDGPMAPATALQWRRYVEKRGPIKYHFLREHHEDHTACGSMMGADMLVTSEVSAAEQLKSAARDDDEMRRTLNGWSRNQYYDPDLVSNYSVRQPNMTFGRRLRFTLGGKRFVVFEAPGHTQGSLVVHAVDDRIAFVADNIFPGVHAPVVQSGDPWSWLKNLAIIEALDVDWYIPGHGDPMGREGISNQRKSLLDAIDVIRKLKAAGKSREYILDNAMSLFSLRGAPPHRGDADFPPGLHLLTGKLLLDAVARLHDHLDEHPSMCNLPSIRRIFRLSRDDGRAAAETAC